MTTIKRMLSVFLITLLLLSGCAAPACTAEKAPAASTTAPTAAPTPESPVVTSLLRVIAADESGSTLLADISNRAVYRNHLPDGKAYPVGTLLEVTTTASVMAIYPAQFDKVQAVKLLEEGFDDRCALYLQVLEDLWKEDQALQSEIDYIGIDLSETSLTPSEQDALAWRFAELKGKQLVQGTWEELAEQGFIDKENLYWENGCLLSIHEEGFLTDEEKDPNKITFRAEKWRSGLGAIMFTDCTAERNKTGHWSEYTPGGFAIA